MLPLGEVGRVANHLLGLDYLALALDVYEPVFDLDALDGLVQHVGTAINGREACEALNTCI